jgi:hypothetical protein
MHGHNCFFLNPLRVPMSSYYNFVSGKSMRFSYKVFHLAKKVENHNYIPNLGLQYFLRTTTINPKNHPDNCQVPVHVSNAQHWYILLWHCNCFTVETIVCHQSHEPCSEAIGLMLVCQLLLSFASNAGSTHVIWIQCREEALSHTSYS